MVGRHALLCVILCVFNLRLLRANQRSKVTNNSGVQPAERCGTWVKEAQGGSFTSPNYPSKYPAEQECTYILEAAPKQCIDLHFDTKYAVEPSWECKFDHIEVRDGPFPFSPIIGRYCGQQSPSHVRSSGRYLWIRFITDAELEAIGFLARYSFTADPDFKETGVPLPLCDFELEGPAGVVDSEQISRDGKALNTEAVDCRWFIRAPPRAKIYLRFLDYELHNSNECKRNFVAIYDGSGSVIDLRKKFCSTVAIDVMLVSSLGVVRMWADEGSRKSRFRILFTTFQEPPCNEESFFCHSNMCINTSLVCNGEQNCVFPWDENHCKEKRKPTILEKLDSTNLALIGVTCSVVFILLIVSVVVQIKQPRTKYLVRRDAFDPALFQEALGPPHYELCTIGSTASSADAMPDFDRFYKRSTSKCVRDHHCGSQTPSLRGSRSNLSSREVSILSESQTEADEPPGVSADRRSVVVFKHGYSDAETRGIGEDLEVLEQENVVARQ